jgi:acyl transferase domain-containing protein
MQTEVTQPAVFVHSVAACELLMTEGLEPIAVAGHSLGEYSALVAAGALSFEVALALVGPRGKLMQAAGVARPGAMGVLIGLDDAQITPIKHPIAPGRATPAACINLPRGPTNARATSKDSAPAATNAEYSPRLCPATAIGSSPSVMSNSQAATLCTKTAGWVTSVCISRSSGPSKQI